MRENVNQNMSFESPVRLFTLDDIVIDTLITIQTVLCSSSEAFEGYFDAEYSKFLFDRGIIFIEFDI